jgi:hypothetical protein
MCDIKADSSMLPSTIFSMTRSINRIPVEVWKEHICQKFLNLSELSILRRTNTFFQKYWQNEMAHVMRVPHDCSTMEEAMALAVIFSASKEYTETDPLKIQLEEGGHKIVGDQYGFMNVICSHITFVGKGKNLTTICGGFQVINQNVKFEELTITNQNGHGLYLEGSETNVDVWNCAVKKCRRTGMLVRDGATVTATQCEFMENSNGAYCADANTKAKLTDCTIHQNANEGLVAFDYAVVDLYGEKTDIHHNKGHGIRASSHGKVIIHLSREHDTSHDNVGDDRSESPRWRAIANTG